VREAFNDRAPVFHGEAIAGFCGLCNLHGDVNMRQWFVCGPCWNIVIAYQKSITASTAVREWWEQKIKPAFKTLSLTETEPVYLAPYVRGKTTKLQNAASLEILDFLVTDESVTPAKPLFHIEQKTGPTSIEEMDTFQLDVNDYNDIAGACNFTTTPSYIVHVQAGRHYVFPTRRTTVLGMWWTDIFTLKEHQLRVAQRRNEDKRAISFNPSAFKPIDTFSDELTTKGYQKLAATLATSQIPSEK
jgi:hypothetical protein